MLSKERPKKVTIYITTYSKPRRKYTVEMDKPYGPRNENSRFICSICLNDNARKEEQKNLECDKRKSKSCPMCQGTANISHERINKADKTENKVEDNKSKSVHPSKINIDHGLNLLTEVLTVFQNQKEHNGKEKCRPIVLKDACVSADILKSKSKLSISKIFQLSIEGGCCVPESGKFCLVDAYQPKVDTNSQCSIDLIKHKSSSIPQMKMEELKNSLKEKTKPSKDAIEEVHRMFATVKRDDNFDNVNRPLIRNGPRVLPVVKTSSEKPSQSLADSDQSHKEICKCCQNSQNYYLSSGDSLAKKETCEKSVNVECCNKNHNRVHKEMQVCERCRKPDNGFDY